MVFVTYLDALSKVLPILLLLALGVFLNKTQFLRPATIQDFKKLVLNITLPAVLFVAFSRVSLEPRHLVIVAIVFTACILGLLVGRLLRSLFRIPSPYFPMLMTGFEAGMMGYAIYTAVYGTDNVFKFAVIDLGQVTFVFFVLVSVLQRQSIGARPFSETLKGFFKTPVIIAIFAGIVANQIGVMEPLQGWPISASVLKTLDLIGGLTTPLVAIIIGYEMKLAWTNIARPLQSIGLRLLFWIPVGLLLCVLVLDQWLGLDRGFQAAMLTMFVLPAPFVLPLFIDEADTENRTFVVNTLSLSTVVTLVAFAIISLVYTRV